MINSYHKSNDMLESNNDSENGCNNSYKNPLPPIVYQTENDKEAYMKNRKEQMRLIKILDHLKIQVQVYGQLFQKEKQVSRSGFETLYIQLSFNFFNAQRMHGCGF